MVGLRRESSVFVAHSLIPIRYGDGERTAGLTIGVPTKIRRRQRPPTWSMLVINHLRAPLLLAACSLAPCRRAPGVACKAASGDAAAFDFEVDLGDGGGSVEHSLEPYFTDSSLITLRVPLPFNLEADPKQGCWEVQSDGYGLRVGDILRAFSTLVLRYDSEERTTRMGPGLPGRPSDDASASDENMPKFLSEALQSNWNPFTAFSEKPLAKCLFVADGEPHSRVQDALLANEAGKVREIVLIFERPDEA